MKYEATETQDDQFENLIKAPEAESRTRQTVLTDNFAGDYK